MKAFKKDMECIINTIDTEKLPGYKRLLTEEYWKISDDKFPEIIDEVIGNIKDGSLKLVEIVKLFGYFSYFSKRGLIDYKIDELKTMFLEAMDSASESSEYCDNIEEELSRIGLDVGDEMSEVVDHFHKLNNILEDKMYRKKADDIFKCIPMKMEQFYDRFLECMDKPILNHYDAYQMFQRVTCASNEDIMLIKEMLVDRFKKYTDELALEAPFIKKLKRVLDDYCKGKETSIKLVMLKEFANDLNDILELYNNETYSYLLEEEDLLLTLEDI